MEIINSEYTKLDKENNIVHLAYFINGQEIAKIIFNYNNDKTEVSGDLYNLIGYTESEEDKNKYKEFLKTQKWFAKEILNKF